MSIIFMTSQTDHRTSKCHLTNEPVGGWLGGRFYGEIEQLSQWNYPAKKLKKRIGLYEILI